MTSQTTDLHDALTRSPGAPPSSAWARSRARLGRRTAPGAIDAVGLLALVAFSAWLRWPLLRVWFWVDEGLTAGVARHPLSALPRLLRQDGAPPLYYLVLHGWVRLFGATEVSLHAFSLIAALAIIPVGLWVGWSLVSPRAGWILAVLLATNPFLTKYSGEARQYTLFAVFALVVFASYVHAFLFGRRRYLVVFAASLTLLLYTHNWGLYVGVALVAALPLTRLAGRDAREVARDAVLSFGAVALLFAPWLPTLAYQARHTAAPWSPRPGPYSVPANLLKLLGTYQVAAAVSLVTLTGLVLLVMARRRRQLALLATAVTFVVIPPALSWVTSQWQPNWASRYLAAVVGALVFLVAVALVRLRRAGLVALCIIAVVWSHPLHRLQHPSVALSGKSNVAAISAQLVGFLRPGDVVLTAQPEQVGVLRYYLGGSYRYATPMGMVEDPQVFDWRDAEARLRRSTADGTIATVMASVRPEGRLVLVMPVGVPGARAAAWVRLFYQRGSQLDAGLGADPQLTLVDRVGARLAQQSATTAWVWAEVFQRHT